MVDLRQFGQNDPRMRNFLRDLEGIGIRDRNQTEENYNYPSEHPREFNAPVDNLVTRGERYQSWKGHGYYLLTTTPAHELAEKITRAPQELDAQTLASGTLRATNRGFNNNPGEPVMLFLEVPGAEGTPRYYTARLTNDQSARDLIPWTNENGLQTNVDQLATQVQWQEVYYSPKAWKDIQPIPSLDVTLTDTAKLAEQQRQRSDAEQHQQARQAVEGALTTLSKAVDDAVAAQNPARRSEKTEGVDGAAVASTVTLPTPIERDGKTYTTLHRVRNTTAQTEGFYLTTAGYDPNNEQTHDQERLILRDLEPQEGIELATNLTEQVHTVTATLNRNHERETNAAAARGMRWLGGAGAVAAGVGALLANNKWLGLAAAAIGGIVGVDLLAERGRNGEPAQNADIGQWMQDAWKGLQTLFQQQEAHRLPG